MFGVLSTNYFRILRVIEQVRSHIRIYLRNRFIFSITLEKRLFLFFVCSSMHLLLVQLWPVSFWSLCACQFNTRYEQYETSSIFRYQILHVGSPVPRDEIKVDSGARSAVIKSPSSNLAKKHVTVKVQPLTELYYIQLVIQQIDVRILV